VPEILPEMFLAFAKVKKPILDDFPFLLVTRYEIDPNNQIFLEFKIYIVVV
jgi:hypothetical protein